LPGELPTLIIRQGLVLLPARLAFVDGELTCLLELRSGPSPLGGGHACPFSHSGLDELAFIRGKLGHPLGKFQPLLFPLGVDQCPITLQRGQSLLLCDCQASPRRTFFRVS